MGRYRITDLDAADRPRERLASVGAVALSNAELIASQCARESIREGKHSVRTKTCWPTSTDARQLSYDLRHAITGWYW
jgi:hypothetical protein